MLNEVNAKKETAVKTSDLRLQLRNRNRNWLLPFLCSTAVVVVAVPDDDGLEGGAGEAAVLRSQSRLKPELLLHPQAGLGVAEGGLGGGAAAPGHPG